MALQNIFINMKLHDVVHLYPWQLNNELYINLKKNLKNKVEKKCIDVGLICNIYNIENYNGYIIPEDLSGNVAFNVTYNANVCVPLPGYQIIMKVEQIIKQAIMVKNGPVAGIVKFTDINNNIFSTTDSNQLLNIKTNQPLKIGDHVKVTVKSKRSFIGETNIGILGFINDYATNEEIIANMYIDLEEKDDVDNIKNVEYGEINEVEENINENNISDYIMEI